MKCPVDDETLVMADRNGVEIDYCPKCRGVWLDRGELDRILERAAVPPPVPADPPRDPYQDRPREYREEPRRTEYRDDRDYRRKYDDDDDYRHGKRKKRDSFLSDLFDF
ncbi:MAG: zf-TFIIB domain-containing protein [Paracoccaceae bacterium]